MFYQQNIHNIFNRFVNILVKLNIFEINIQGEDKINQIKNELIVANHPSLMDVVFLISILPKVTCIVKPAVWYNPFMKNPVRGAQYIKSDQAETLIQDCVDIITEDKRSILIFPEGTRTLKGNQLNPLKKGFANIVYKQNILVRPITITMNPRFLCKEDKWYNIPKGVVKVTIDIEDPLDVQKWYQLTDSRSIAVRKITTQMYEYFLKRIK
ncbi:1-acyl-sn-glycerol-3-phosphate acyltransferase [Neisseriaceae bacterium PsAf]|nr:1-acyl-sn-glycerol-3-phosphate acyltransferase [Neisseriaceae bacterium PsAf]